MQFSENLFSSAIVVEFGVVIPTTHIFNEGHVFPLRHIVPIPEANQSRGGSRISS
jgi:hypothetical protein